MRIASIKAGTMAIAGATLAALLMLAAPARAALTIEITEGVEGALPIAVVPFGWSRTGEPPQRIAEIVGSDLRRSGRFTPAQRSALPARPHAADQVNYQAWRSAGQDNLVVGEIVPRGEDSYTVRFQLLDVLRGEQLAGYSYTVKASQMRRLAHQISDIVYERLIGERGAFDTRIAYVKATSGEGDKTQHQLIVADWDGHNPRVALTSPEPIMSPAWSPDGRRLAYVSFENGRSEIYVQNVATQEREVVASYEGMNQAPAFAPDGERLALTLSKDGQPEVYVLNLQSRELARITRSSAIDTEAAWGPDGEVIYFTSDRGGQPQIYRAQRHGGRAQRVTFEGTYNARPAVSSDGRELATVQGRDGKYRIAIKDLDSGLVTTLTDGPLDESPSFAPNASMLLYADGSGRHGTLAAVSSEGTAHQSLAGEGDVREPAWGPFREQ